MRSHFYTITIEIILMVDFQRHVSYCLAVGIWGGWVSGPRLLSGLKGLAVLSCNATIASAFSYDDFNILLVMF